MHTPACENGLIASFGFQTDQESFCGMICVELQVKELRNEFRQKTEELRNKEERVKNLTREKQLLEQKVSRLEKNKTEEVKRIFVDL